MAGYIQKRVNGTFRLIVTSGRDAEGKPIRYSKTVHVATRKEADKLMALYVAEIESIKNQPPLNRNQTNLLLKRLPHSGSPIAKED